jgi:tetratricopeptide (TPR) repeat protein
MNWVWILWGFKLWMLFDVFTRRRGPIVWIALVLFIPSLSFGGVLYFFLAKAIDRGWIRGLDTLAATKIGVTGGHGAAPLRGNQTTLRRLRAADELERRAVYPEAILLYESVLSTEPDNARARHGLARCKLGTGHPSDACELLERVLAGDREFGGYSAALDYAEALHQSKRGDEAIELLRGLALHTGKINHRLALAHYLAALEHIPEAVSVLEDAKAAYLGSGDETKAQDRSWFEKVEERLQSLAN